MSNVSEGTTTAEKLHASEISLVNLWGGPNNDQHLDVLLASGVIRTLKPLESGASNSSTNTSSSSSSSDRAAECRRWCRALEQLIHNPVGPDSDNDNSDDDEVQSQQRQESLNSLVHNSTSGRTKGSSPMSYSTTITESSSKAIGDTHTNTSGNIVNVVLRKGGQTVDSSMMHATVPTSHTTTNISKSLSSTTAGNGNSKPLATTSFVLNNNGYGHPGDSTNSSRRRSDKSSTTFSRFHSGVPVSRDDDKDKKEEEEEDDAQQSLVDQLNTSLHDMEVATRRVSWGE